KLFSRRHATHSTHSAYPNCQRTTERLNDSVPRTEHESVRRCHYRMCRRLASVLKHHRALGGRVRGNHPGSANATHSACKVCRTKLAASDARKMQRTTTSQSRDTSGTKNRS